MTKNREKELARVDESSRTAGPRAMTASANKAARLDQMVTELKAAGWVPVRATRWRDPNGNLHVGPTGAYRVLKAFQACALVLESALREKEGQ